MKKVFQLLQEMKSGTLKYWREMQRKKLDKDLGALNAEIAEAQGFLHSASREREFLQGRITQFQ